MSAEFKEEKQEIYKKDKNGRYIYSYKERVQLLAELLKLEKETADNNEE